MKDHLIKYTTMNGIMCFLISFIFGLASLIFTESREVLNFFGEVFLISGACFCVIGVILIIVKIFNKDV